MPSRATAKPQIAPAKARLDLRTPFGAALAILVLRLVLGLWALPISARFPETNLEKTIALWPPATSLANWLERILVAPWIRYDALHYAEIAIRGYDLKEGQTAFHPLFPLLAKPFILMGLPPGAALLIIATLASGALCLVFARYVAKFHGDISHNKAAWLLLGGLCGFLLFAPYNESLFLLLAVSCLWAMRDERFWLAGFLGALATLTRQQGIALLVPLIWQIAVSRRVAWHTFFAPLLLLSGYGAFVAYRLFVLHDADFSRATSPLEIARMILVSPASQNVVPGQHLAPPWETVMAQIRLINARNLDLLWDLLIGGVMIFWALSGWRHLHPAERIFAVTIVLLSLCYYNGHERPLLSLPRHMMLAFPLYISLARWIEQKSANIVFQLALVVNFFLAGAYFRNGWVP